MPLKDIKHNQSYLFLFNYFLFVLIYLISILSEDLLYSLGLSEIKKIKYLIILIICLHSLFIVIKNNFYIKNNQYFDFFVLLFAPYIFNGLLGLFIFFKAISAIFVGFYFAFFLQNKNYKKIINRYVIFLFTVFLLFLIFQDNFNFKEYFNHKNDFGNLLLFLLFIFVITQEKTKNFYILGFLILVVLFLLYIFEMRSQFLLIFLFILYFYFRRFRFIKWHKILKLLIIFITLFLVSLNLFNLKKPSNPYLSKFQNNLIYIIEIVEHVSSQRISRLIGPCEWANTRYYLNRNFSDILEGNSSYKNCSIYNLNDEIPIVPIFFLNYKNIDLVNPYFNNNGTLINELFRMHKINESMNLDNSFNEILRFNGVIAFIYFFTIFSILIIRLQKKCNINLLFILFPFVIYFALQSGFGSPGNLIFIVFIILVYRLISNEKKVFNHYLH